MIKENRKKGFTPALTFTNGDSHGGRNNKSKLVRGFTLVESLVAISVLSLSIAGSYLAVQQSLQASTAAKDRIIAFYLAQESMEFIKNIRDENTLHYIANKSTDWLASLAHSSSDPCYFGKTCTIDSATKTFTTCPGDFDTCPNLNQNTITGLYSYASGPGWVATNYKRGLQLDKKSNDEVVVTVSTSWTSRGINHSFQVQEVILNHICP